MIWIDEKMSALDFETSGTQEEFALQPWRVPPGQAWVTSLSFIRWNIVNGMPKLAPDGSSLLVGWAPEQISSWIRAILQRAIDEDLWVIGWNIVFDIQWCIAYGCADLVHHVKWLDGMLLWRHLMVEPEYEMDRAKKRAYKLKPDAVEHFIPIMAGYQEDVNFHSVEPSDLAKLQKYNDKDSVSAWVITKMIWCELTEKQRDCALIEAACLSMVAEANYRGMPVDTLIARELAAKLERDAAVQLEKLAPHGVTEKIVRSPMQLGKLLFDDWKLPVLKENTGAKTGKISRATDKEVLHELAFIDPRAKELRAYREALNNKTKFADTPLISAEYNGDGMSRPSGIVFGTYTSRMTYASSQGRGKGLCQIGFALHQEKRGKEFRSIIGSPPGYTLMEFDASGQEFRWMAIKSGDQAMLQLCQPGEDAHSYMAARIVGADYRELVARVKAEDEDANQNRYLGKVANLSLQYRTYPKTFRKVARVQYDIPMELPEAQRIHRTYQQTYPGVPTYWDHQIRLVKHNGYAETLAGRRVQVVGNWEGKLAWKMESTALNYPVQGTGGDQKYLAMQIIKPYLLSIGAYFAWDLHDGIYLWVPDDKVVRAAIEIKRLLANLPYREAWGFTPPIPLPWDCKFGKLWGTLKEFKDS